MRFGDDRGSYEIENLPGSPQVAVSIHSFIFKEKRGKGYGKAMHLERLAKLKELGYDYVLCTVRDDNKAEIHILETNGWRYLDMFYSSATGNLVQLFARDV